MRIDQLKQIKEISQAGSINRAAENLFISQSSLSLSLRSAERELGQLIFERSYNGIRPTAFGVEILREIDTMLNCWNRIENTAGERVQRKKTPSLRVSSQFLLFVSKVFAEILAQQNGNGNFSLLEKPWSSICRDIEKGDSDIGVICIPGGNSAQRHTWLRFLETHKIAYKALSQGKAVAMVGPSNRLYRLPGSSIMRSQLAPYANVYFKSEVEGISMELTEESMLPAIPCSGAVAVSDRGSLHSLLQRGDCFSIGCQSAAYQQMEYYRDVRMLVIEDVPFLEFGWIKKEGRELSALEKKFVAQVEKLLRTSASTEGRAADRRQD